MPALPRAKSGLAEVKCLSIHERASVSFIGLFHGSLLNIQGLFHRSLLNIVGAMSTHARERALYLCALAKGRAMATIGS